MNGDFSEIGQYCYELAGKLFPICRSLTGPGVRETLSILKAELPELKIWDVPSGTKAFDWTVPDEWVIRGAYIEDSEGRRILDFNNNNLHIVGYSAPVDQHITLEELEDHLHSLPDQPDAIPYITSYYKRRWGFCITHNQRKTLKPGKYHVVIDSTIQPGILNYADLIIPGNSSKEIFISTYICHPSMANNEVSGPVVVVALARWLYSLPSRKFTYRIVFVPETIGSILYLSRHMDTLKRNVIAGFNISCVGDDRSYSYLPSRAGNTLADQAALHALKYTLKGFKKYTWLERGSDERQYCSPGIDLPVASIMRSKYGEYAEYHTSLDNMELISPKGLQGGFLIHKNAIEIIENNVTPKVTVFCEPQLGKYGLYETLSQKGVGIDSRTLLNLISYCDGSKTLLEISELVEKPMEILSEMLKKLTSVGLVDIITD